MARTLPLLLALAMTLAACGQEASGPDPRNNQIKVIQPYWAKGTWVFDDKATGLQQEPFVHGIPEMIDRLATLPARLRARAADRRRPIAMSSVGHRQHASSRQKGWDWMSDRA